MDLASWREKRQGEKFTLPSGLEVTLRKADLLDLAALGRIPSLLVDAANRMVGGAEVKVEKFKDQVEIINLVVTACLVAPEIGETADDTHILVSELTVQDRLAIYNWASAGVARLLPFREKPGEPAGAGPGSDALRDETERAAGGG